MKSKTGSIAGFLLLVLLQAHSQNGSVTKGLTGGEGMIPDYFGFENYRAENINEVLKVSLELDFRKLTHNKKKEEYYGARLYWTDENGSERMRKVRIRTRGEFRKNYCVFPPLKISFKPDREARSPDIPALKLVTHCRGGRNYEDYLLREYLAYRIYNLITDYSYRVRLLEVEYRDTRGKTPPYSRYAFIIEAEKQLEERLNGKFLEDREVSIVRTDYESCQKLALFQYMIGNTDWQILKQHNIEILETNDSMAIRPVPIPFDFDYCGLVNAVYAIPHEDLPIETVRERMYLGNCIDEEEFYRFFDWYLSLHPRLVSFVDAFYLMKERERRDVTAYLEEFFSIISDERRARHEIIRNCLGR